MARSPMRSAFDGPFCCGAECRIRRVRHPSTWPPAVSVPAFEQEGRTRGRVGRAEPGPHGAVAAGDPADGLLQDRTPAIASPSFGPGRLEDRPWPDRLDPRRDRGSPRAVVRKLEDIDLIHAVPAQQVAHPVGLEIAGQQQRHAPVPDRPPDLDHLRAVVVPNVPVVGMWMQPAPSGPQKLRDAPVLADLDRNVVRSCRFDQLRRRAGRIARGGRQQGAIRDQAIGREPPEYRGHRSEVIHVRMAHDDRLDAAHAGRSQRRNHGADPERGVVKASGIEHHRPGAVPEHVT